MLAADREQPRQFHLKLREGGGNNRWKETDVEIPTEINDLLSNIKGMLNSPWMKFVTTTALSKKYKKGCIAKTTLQYKI